MFTVVLFPPELDRKGAEDAFKDPSVAFGVKSNVTHALAIAAQLCNSTGDMQQESLDSELQQNPPGLLPEAMPAMANEPESKEVSLWAV